MPGIRTQCKALVPKLVPVANAVIVRGNRSSKITSRVRGLPLPDKVSHVSASENDALPIDIDISSTITVNTISAKRNRVRDMMFVVSRTSRDDDIVTAQMRLWNNVAS